MKTSRLASVLVLSCTLMLSACYTDINTPNDDYTWYKSSEIALPMQVVQADQAFVVDLCDASPDILACAQRLPHENICKVYTSYPELPQWVLDHEKRHCDGWSHKESAKREVN